ncbi:MAG: hypothetical protein WCK41_00325 [Actinomycetes bacterium]
MTESENISELQAEIARLQSKLKSELAAAERLENRKAAAGEAEKFLAWLRGDDSKAPTKVGMAVMLSAVDGALLPTGRPGTSGTGAKRTRKQLPAVADVASAVDRQTGEFTLNDLAATLNETSARLRKPVDELIASSKVTEVKKGGRGRAAVFIKAGI